MIKEEMRTTSALQRVAMVCDSCGIESTNKDSWTPEEHVMQITRTFTDEDGGYQLEYIDFCPDCFGAITDLMDDRNIRWNRI